MGVCGIHGRSSGSDATHGGGWACLRHSGFVADDVEQCSQQSVAVTARSQSSQESSRQEGECGCGGLGKRSCSWNAARGHKECIGPESDNSWMFGRRSRAQHRVRSDGLVAVESDSTARQTTTQRTKGIGQRREWMLAVSLSSPCASLGKSRRARRGSCSFLACLQGAKRDAPKSPPATARSTPARHAPITPQLRQGC